MIKATILKTESYAPCLHSSFPPVNCSASPPLHLSVHLLFWVPSGNMPYKREGGRPRKKGCRDTTYFPLYLWSHRYRSSPQQCLIFSLPASLCYHLGVNKMGGQHRRSFGGGIRITGSSKLCPSKTPWILDTHHTLARKYFFIHTSGNTYLLCAFATFVWLFEKQQ